MQRFILAKAVGQSFYYAFQPLKMLKKEIPKNRICLLENNECRDKAGQMGRPLHGHNKKK